MTSFSNTLLHGDALSLLERLPSDYVALVYLDPPFDVEPISFPHADEAHSRDGDARLRQYLVFISEVVQQVRRVLTDKGSVFFHTTPSLSGSIHAILDQVFGHRNFREEIIWPHTIMRRKQHDSIYLFSKTQERVYYPPTRPLTQSEIKAKFTHADGDRLYYFKSVTRRDPGRPKLRYEWRGYTPPQGHCWIMSKDKMDELYDHGKIVPSGAGLLRMKQYLDEKTDLAVDVGTVWDDLSATKLDRSIGAHYPTQQPLSLLRRIISMSTNRGDLVVDPFSGSGVSLVAAQELGRRWIGCDTNPVAHSAALMRLEAGCGLVRDKDFRVIVQEEFERENSVINQAYAPIHLHVGQPSVKELIQRGESLTLEFKALLRGTMRDKKDAYDLEYACLKTVSAFMNSNGGILLIGVKDNGDIIGIENDGFENHDKFGTHFWHIFSASIGTAYSRFVKTSFEKVDGKSVYIVRCDKSDSPAYLRHKCAKAEDDEFFVRTGPSSTALTRRDMVDYIRKNFGN